MIELVIESFPRLYPHQEGAAAVVRKNPGVLAIRVGAQTAHVNAFADVARLGCTQRSPSALG